MNYREILIRLMSMTTPFVYDSEESFLQMLRKFYKYHVNDEIANLRNYVDSEDALLNERIRQIEIGNIRVYDPSTGLYSPIQIVIDNLYDMGRSNALTASEYDALELSATAYDNYELTARDYDLNGKSLLI